MSRSVLNKSVKSNSRAENLPSADKLFASRRFNDKAQASAGIVVCKRCHAINSSKHWYCDVQEFTDLKNNGKTKEALCPGCNRIEGKIYEGQVLLHSDKLNKDKNMLLSLIKHTEGKAWFDNPASRIGRMTWFDNRLEIYTTTKWLATRIGKEIKKAFKGQVEIKPSPEENYVRVYCSY